MDKQTVNVNYILAAQTIISQYNLHNTTFIMYRYRRIDSGHGKL